MTCNRLDTFLLTPQARFELATSRLTVDRSTTELLRNALYLTQDSKPSSDLQPLFQGLLNVRVGSVAQQWPIEHRPLISSG